MKIDFGNILLIVFLSYLFLMWFSLVMWVWGDVRSRTNDRYFQYIALILAAVGNIFGVAVYMVIRPRETFSEQFFTDLEQKIIIAQAKEFGVLDEKQLAAFSRKPSKRKSRSTSR